MLFFFLGQSFDVACIQPGAVLSSLRLEEKTVKCKLSKDERLTHFFLCIYVLYFIYITIIFSYVLYRSKLSFWDGEVEVFEAVDCSLFVTVEAKTETVKVDEKDVERESIMLGTKAGVKFSFYELP